MYIVPPQLQRQLLVGGFTVPELLIYLVSFLFLIIVGFYQALFIVATLGFMSWRFKNKNDRNTFYFLKILYKYYEPAQAFTRRLTANAKESPD